MECLRAEIEQEITLTHLAKIADLSNRQFLRQFLRSTGSTPGRMQAEMRMELASRLLRGSSISVTEIRCNAGSVNRSISPPRFAGDTAQRHLSTADFKAARETPRAHQRIAALRKSDGVTPVAFLNAVLKC